MPSIAERGRRRQMTWKSCSMCSLFFFPLFIFRLFPRLKFLQNSRSLSFFCYSLQPSCIYLGAAGFFPYIFSCSFCSTQTRGHWVKDCGPAEQRIEKNINYEISLFCFHWDIAHSLQRCIDYILPQNYWYKSLFGWPFFFGEMWFVIQNKWR